MKKLSTEINAIAGLAGPAGKRFERWGKRAEALEMQVRVQWRRGFFFGTLAACVGCAIGIIVVVLIMGVW
jgi:hypothetical protein